MADNGGSAGALPEGPDPASPSTLLKPRGGGRD